MVLFQGVRPEPQKLVSTASAPASTASALRAHLPHVFSLGLLVTLTVDCSLTNAWWCPKGLENQVGSPGTAILDGLEPSSGWWVPNPGPLREQVLIKHQTILLPKFFHIYLFI